MANHTVGILIRFPDGQKRRTVAAAYAGKARLKSVVGLVDEGSGLAREGFIGSAGTTERSSSGSEWAPRSTKLSSPKRGKKPSSRASQFSLSLHSRLVRKRHGLNVAKTALQLVLRLTLNVAAYAPVEVTTPPSLSAEDVFVSRCSIVYPLPADTVPV